MTVSETIRSEQERDRAAIWAVNSAAFEGEAEAKLVEALRDGELVEVSLVAELGGVIVGHILFSRVAVVTETGTVQALSLAPMAVLPGHQRQGIGSRLVDAGLDACRALVTRSWSCLAIRSSTHGSGSPRNWLGDWSPPLAAVTLGWHSNWNPMRWPASKAESSIRRRLWRWSNERPEKAVGRLT